MIWLDILIIKWKKVAVIGTALLSLVCVVFFLFAQNEPWALLLSKDVAQVESAYKDSFWVDDNDFVTYTLSKQKYQEIRNRNQKKVMLTETELNDEMVLATNYAASARNIYPEEGLRVFAQIYNDERYSGAIRANALLHAMFYPIEKVGTDELSIQNVNDWIFADELLGSVLKDSKYEGVYLNDKRSIYEASAYGLAKAAEISNSDSLSSKINSVRLDLNLNLHVDDLANMRKNDIWVRLDELLWTEEELQPIHSMLEDYDVFTDHLISMLENYPVYDDKYSHAAKNILRSYTTMLAFGIDTQDRIDLLNQKSLEYINKFMSDTTEAGVESMKSYRGVNALYMACSYIIETGYNLENVHNLNTTISLLQPFFELSHDDIRIFLITASLGQRESGVCFYPYVLLGQKNVKFRDALVNGVGGWQASQFE